MDNRNLTWDKNGIVSASSDDGEQEEFFEQEEAAVMGFEPPEDDSLSEADMAKLEAQAEEAEKAEAEARAQAEAEAAAKEEANAKKEAEISDDRRKKRRKEEDKRPATPYESDRWRGLVAQENFLKIEDRAELYPQLKEKFSAEQVLRCYYSSLLELTYTVGDYLWATKLRDNRDRENKDVLKVMSEYEVEGSNLDYVVRSYRARMDNSFEEFNSWSELLYFLPLTEKDKRRMRNFIAKKNYVNWLRKQVRKLLAELNTDIMPKNLTWLCRRKYALDERRAASKAAKAAKVAAEAKEQSQK